MALFRSTTRDFFEMQLEYHLQDPAILAEAIDASGLVRPESNTRLAILGDTILKSILVGDWYTTMAPRVRATTILNEVGSNANLATVGRSVGIEPFLQMNPGHRGPVSDKTVATAVEALLGAVFLDSGCSLEIVGKVMDTIGLIPT